MIVGTRNILLALFPFWKLGTTLLGEKQPLFDGRTSPVPEAILTAYGQ